MTMDEKTIKATQGAWLKWDKIAKGKAKNGGSNDCPLCELFLNGGRGGCSGCPIKAATGKAGCWGTPHIAYAALESWLGPDSHTTREAAYAFRNFINLLLPPERRMPKRRAKP